MGERLTARAARAARFGHLPDFLVLGGQRCATTSLASWLRHHPQVALPPAVKEVHYFDGRHDAGDRWYRRQFLRFPGRGVLTGEATPYYLFHPAVPVRAAALVPDARLVVLLRDPVERAASQHRLSVRKGHDDLAFADAVAAEETRLAGEAERLLSEPGYFSHSHCHHSYVTRGRYAVQLEAWLQHYPREQLHVLFSAELFERPTEVLADLAEFLGIGPGAAGLPHENETGGTTLAPDLVAHLRDAYADDDARLADLLARPLPWRP